jgi:nucleoside-diphosphate-sugar epimerase
MRILISGGLGFIGSYIAEHYLNRGSEVTIVDCQIPIKAYQKELSKKINFYNCYFQDFNSSVKYDIIYNCASPVGILDVIKFQGKIVQDIVGTTNKSIELCSNDTHLVHISTSEVYGQNGELQEHNPCVVNVSGHARKEYQAGKLAAEIMLMNCRLPCTIIRPFNICGPRQMADKGFVVSRFFESCKANHNLEVFYSGKQSRCFCYVEDFVDAITNLASVKASGIYNVGSPDNKSSIIDLANTIKNMLSSSSKIVYCNPEEIYDGFVEGFEKIPDISKLQKEIDWKPRTNLYDSLDIIRKFYE